MVEMVAEPECSGQDERRGGHRAGRGSPGPPGGRGNGVRGTSEEQTAPAASAQAFA